MTFAQISDSHIGFNQPANPDVVGTLQATVDKINALPQASEFIIHTGDLSHMSKPAEFDALDQMLKSPSQARFSMCPASMTRRWMTANSIWSVAAKARGATAGTASITRRALCRTG